MELIDGDDGPSDESPMTIRKLSIKIKLPEKQTKTMIDEYRTETEDDDDEMNKEDADEEYACSLCGKGFRSRKALGGHMRVHAQQQRREVLMMMMISRNDVVNQLNATSDVELEEDGDENKPICCPICQRDFPSSKALFGHMRCHPERSWRGIQPPPPPPVYKNSSSSTVSDVNDDIDDVNKLEKYQAVKQVVDLEKGLSGFGWGAKAIRGRDAITTKPSSSSSPPAGLFVDLVDVEPEQVDGVQSLILLSMDDIDRHGDQPPAVCGVRDNVNYMMKNKKLKYRGAELKSNHQETSLQGKKRKNYSQVLTAEDGDQEEAFQHPNEKFKVTEYHDNAAPANSELILMQADQEANKKQMHKVRKYLKVNDHFRRILSLSAPVTNKSIAAVNMDQQVERYRCTTCNKSFSSHQALGGHKSSHNKLQTNTPTATISRPNNIDRIQHSSDHSPRPEAAQAQGGEAGLILTMSSGGGAVHPPLHQCNVCFKIYLSGQALGGHKRLHCTATTSSTTTSLVSRTPPHLLLPKPLHRNMVTAAEPPLPPAVPSIVVPDQPLADDTTPAPTVPLAPAAVSPDNKGFFRCFNLNELPPLEDDDNNTTSMEQPQPEQEES